MAPRGEEGEAFRAATAVAAEAALCIVDEGPLKAQNRYNVK